MTTTVTNTILLQELAAGQEQAWQRLCERHEPMLLRLARRAGLREDQAADVAQEALTALLEGLRVGKYDRQRGRLRQWLCGIATNKIHEARRRAKPREMQPCDGTSSTGLLDRAPDECELADIYEQEWARAVLNECLRRVESEFEPKTLEVFRLYAIQNRPPDEVAAKLGIGREAVFVYKSRVLTRLQALREEVAEIW